MYFPIDLADVSPIAVFPKATTQIRLGNHATMPSLQAAELSWFIQIVIQSHSIPVGLGVQSYPKTILLA